MDSHIMRSPTDKIDRWLPVVGTSDVRDRLAPILLISKG